MLEPLRFIFIFLLSLVFWAPFEFFVSAQGAIKWSYGSGLTFLSGNSWIRLELWMFAIISKKADCFGELLNMVRMLAAECCIAVLLSSSREQLGGHLTVRDLTDFYYYWNHDGHNHHHHHHTIIIIIFKRAARWSFGCEGWDGYISCPPQRSNHPIIPSSSSSSYHSIIIVITIILSSPS